MKPTVADVAREARVSTATVSRALRFPEQVTPERLARVTAAVAALDYLPNASARALSTLRSWVVAIVASDLARYAPVVSAVATQLARFGLSSRLVAERDPEMDTLAGEVEATILVPAEPGLEETLRSRGAVCVGLGPGVAAGVRVDVAAAARRLALHLGQSRSGRVVIAADETCDPLQRAWLAALVAALPLACVADAGASAEGMMRRERPSAVVCTSDLGAARVMAAARGRGLEVPADVACAGWGDEPFAQCLSPSLTTLRLPWQSVGTKLAQQALAMRAGGAAMVTAVEPKLVLRGSTGGFT